MALDALAIPFDITWQRLGFMADMIERDSGTRCHVDVNAPRPPRAARPRQPAPAPLQRPDAAHNLMPVGGRMCARRGT